MVPVHVSYYKLLTQTIGSYVEKTNAALAKLQRPLQTSSTGAGPASPERELKIQTNEIVLQPQIHVLGNFTPPNVVDFVLNRFGVQKESIPTATFHTLAANLEHLLSFSNRLLEAMKTR